MTKFTVFKATEIDIPALISLARSVEHLFGPMVGHGFERVLEVNVQRGALLVAREVANSASVIGGLIFDERNAPLYHISWLAVFQQYRGAGIGKSLVSHALAQAKPPCKIDVVTFGSDNKEGMSSRRLYESFGFEPGTTQERGPEGGTRQLFTLLVGES